MNKRARAAAESARRAALDAALDSTIEAAAQPLRVTAGDLARFDALNPDVPALSAARTRRVRSIVGAALNAPSLVPNRGFGGAAPAGPHEVGQIELGGPGGAQRPPSGSSGQRPGDGASFGDVVRAGREAARLTVPDVARRLHVHRDYLTGLESGARSPLALGPDGARRLVGMLGLSPHVATKALEVSMAAALQPTPEFSARMRRGVPRKERRRVLEAALPSGLSEEQELDWRALIDAVEALGD